jgi:AcrR family transcriptional regulator
MGRVAERRAATVDRIVATAREVITEDGAAGLTLGEVARRVGMRTPSLYGYFAGRSDLCDELFRRGWTDLGQAVAHLVPTEGTDMAGLLTEAMDVSVGWALDHPADAQLMFWRPIARWQPSPSAYEPAERVMGITATSLGQAQRLGLLDPTADLEELVSVWVALVAGVISQQLSNEPGVGLADGRTSRHRNALVQMYAAHYSPQTRGSTP